MMVKNVAPKSNLALKQVKYKNKQNDSGSDFCWLRITHNFWTEIENFDHSRSAWEKNWKILDLTADSAHYAFYCIEVHKNTITITDWYIIVKFYAISYKTMLGSDLEYAWIESFYIFASYFCTKWFNEVMDLWLKTTWFW